MIGEWRGKPVLSLTGPYVFRSLRIPEFLDVWHTKVVRLSDLSTVRIYPPVHTAGTHFCYILSLPKSCNTSKVELATFRRVTRFLEQLHHHVPLDISSTSR